MQRFQEFFIDLEEGFPSGEHDKTLPSSRPAPGLFDRQRKLPCGGKMSATGAIYPNEIGVAESAECSCPVAFTSRPKVTAGETTKYGSPPGISSFALKGVENFLDRI
ncbi:hypothetical protein MesoLjLa_60590 [Mesorhizobium sp. L-2-11]|nr:hypothetical protein MesoLjLa_60590 [Mesorhizobium sp. L-2-11]